MADKKSDLEAFLNNQPSLQQTEELPEKSAETAEFQILKIPNDLYYLIEFEIYRGICRKIEEGDPKARELVDWYLENIGVSGESLLEKLRKSSTERKIKIYSKLNNKYYVHNLHYATERRFDGSNGS